MTPSPKQLRAAAQKVQDTREQERKREEKARQREHGKLLKRLREGYESKLIERLDETITSAAGDGKTTAERHVLSSQGNHWTGLSDPREVLYSTAKEAFYPLWENVVKHYEDAGYRAYIHKEVTTEYYRGEAGPGPDHWSIVLDWTE